MVSCGLIGAKLGHSYSPQIHRLFGDYPYVLYELREEEVGPFLKNNGNWTALNVTIPYKKTVLPFMDEVSETVARTGSVNTVVKRPDGTLFGDNTDVYGFLDTVRRSGIDVAGRKTLVLGSGGASVAVREALRVLGAETVVISRSGADNYTNLYRHADAEIIVNTTPLGMFPNNGEAAVNIRDFPLVKGVFDLIYNPAKTELLLECEAAGIPSFNGLHMLVAQAKRSSELFTGRTIHDAEIDRVRDAVAAGMRNIVLIGMPGCGKSTVAAKVGKLTGRTVVDTDSEIVKRTGRTPADIIRNDGEEAFRRVESDILRELGKQSGLVISAGGGVVTREENYKYIRQNSFTVRIKRPLELLPVKGRPLSQGRPLGELAAEREPLYRRFADAEVENVTTTGEAAEDVVRLAGLC
ncbi:MAG: shikimate kinase [Clostridia bacterium]|nr:shikimate kinase [Clostridia bacterium]